MHTVEFLAFALLLSAQINLPLFYVTYSLLLLLLITRFLRNFWEFIYKDKTFHLLLSLNFVLFLLPLNFSSEALRYFLKFTYLFLLFPTLEMVCAKKLNVFNQIYFVSAVFIACIYCLEQLIPFVPKLTFGDMTSSGILGLIATTIIVKNKTNGLPYTFSFIGLCLLVIISKKFFFLDGLLFLTILFFVLISLYRIIVFNKLGLFAFVPIVYSLLLIGKRGPTFSFLVSWTLSEFKKGGRISAKTVCFGLIIIATILVFIFANRLRFSELLSEPRILLWQKGFEIASEHPFGLGYGNADKIREILPAAFTSLRHFHSNYVNILVENGILGLILFLAFIVAAYFRSSSSTKPLLLYFMLSGLFESNYQDSEYLINLIICYFLLDKQSKSKEKDGT